MFKIINFGLEKYGLHTDCRGVTNKLGFISFIMKIFQKYEKRIIYLWLTLAYIKVWMYAAYPYRKVCITMETVYIQYGFDIRYPIFLTQSQNFYTASNINMLQTEAKRSLIRNKPSKIHAIFFIPHFFIVRTALAVFFSLNVRLKTTVFFRLPICRLHIHNFQVRFQTLILPV